MNTSPLPLRKEHKRISVIVKPIHECNMECKYCYLEPAAEQGRMSEETLEKLVDQTMSTHDSVSFIWHGGEPLLMSLDFYKSVVRLQRRYSGKRVTNGFQSNGTLITEEVLDFCEEYGFNIGFSLDGPRVINDQTRTFKNGESSFDQTLAAIKETRKRKLGGGAIVVLNKLNIAQILEIYAFAKEEEINLKINPLIRSGRATESYEELGIGPQEYGLALIRLFDQWFQDGSSVSIDPFEELMGNLLTGQPWGCNYSTSCQYNFISVGPQGDIYPCGRFDGVQHFKLGNINIDDLTIVLNSEKRKSLQKRTSRIKECHPCEYISICNSGCMHNAYMRDGEIDTRDYYCASYKLLFSHITAMMKTELAKAEAL